MSNNKLEFPKGAYLPFVLALLGMPWGFIMFKLLSRSEGPLRVFEFMFYCALGMTINFLIFALIWRLTK